MTQRKRAERSWDEKEIKVKTKYHSKKKKEIKIKKIKRLQNEKEKTDSTHFRRFTDILFFLGCSENEKCTVWGESQKHKKIVSKKS